VIESVGRFISDFITRNMENREELSA
jgi:hypothetical protein